MSTIDVLTITREERDVLHSHITLDEIDMSGLRDGDRENTLEELARGEVVCALLDDIGWNEADDREVYALTVDRDRLVGWLRRQQRLSAEEVQDNLRQLAAQEAGVPDSGSIGHLQESVALSRGFLAQVHRELGLIEGLLGRLGQSMAVA